jgi:hypothetical protein
MHFFIRHSQIVGAPKFDPWDLLGVQQWMVTWVPGWVGSDLNMGGLAQSDAMSTGSINHGLLIRGYPPSSHNMVHKW